MLALLCGRQNLNLGPYTSTSNEMLVLFKTDGSVTYQGFSAHYVSGMPRFSSDLWCVFLGYNTKKNFCYGIGKVGNSQLI